MIESGNVLFWFIVPFTFRGRPFPPQTQAYDLQKEAIRVYATNQAGQCIVVGGKVIDQFMPGELRFKWTERGDNIARKIILGKYPELARLMVE